MTTSGSVVRPRLMGPLLWAPMSKSPIWSLRELGCYKTVTENSKANPKGHFSITTRTIIRPPRATMDVSLAGSLRGQDCSKAMSEKAWSWVTGHFRDNSKEQDHRAFN